MATFRRKPVDFVIDVRSRLEFWFGHLDGARCLPGHSIERTIGTVPNLTKDSRILLYCASGARSAAAAGTLRALGYGRLVDGGALASARRDYVA